MSALPGRAATYRVIHSFSYGDGTYPFAGLLPAGDKLYGTTSAGGKSQTQGGCGTVFVIAALQTESLLHSFQCPPDGEYPTDSLIKVGGDLYGTTQGGGTYRNGTVFALTKSGKEHVIYNFQGGNDGALPEGGLVTLNGKFTARRRSAEPTARGPYLKSRRKAKSIDSIASDI